MRDAELINIVMFGYYSVLALLMPLSGRRRAWIVATSLMVIGVAAAMQHIRYAFIRDLLPALLLLCAYRQSGSFFRGPNARFQSTLERTEMWFAGLLRSRLLKVRGVDEVMESFYMLCYAVVPGGIAALYLLDMQSHADAFWRVALIPPYVCYGAFPFLQSLPPRMSQGHVVTPCTPALRRINLWILDRGSIKANTFPSAHAAAAWSVAMGLFAVDAVAGLVFGIVAAGISVAAVTGRYHYAIDVIVGTAVAAISSLLVFRFWV